MSLPASDRASKSGLLAQFLGSEAAAAAWRKEKAWRQRQELRAALARDLQGDRQGVELAQRVAELEARQAELEDALHRLLNWLERHHRGEACNGWARVVAR